ncbi:hypothetical protein HO133_005166 [Letharia lupina]|uniref:Swiss Army Knife RNA repair protein HAD domain-containing protein n=1 Tax=Letharia lupina TaxID=560253 RepID=A0A8H6CA09_9LECA|nr:uncharacterized protein HO133_005166 [Letharia lupina]KAF6219341.1 hypothetical protein HO133_005166 [Letharia lupina]
MTASFTNGPGPMNQRKVVSHTLTGLKRWSCHSRELPPVDQVKALHVYDFDNTLFMSPLPNQKLWNGQTVGFLQTQECFVNGGWWHDQRILEATGQGIEKEEPKAWEGWWNEQIVDLVGLSIKQNDTLTVLLTGRSEHNFADLIKRIVASKDLSFDMICLKPQAGPNSERFRSTMMYKQAILEDLVHTYKDADEIRIYEDRPKHTKGFRDFFESFNANLLSPAAQTPRKPIVAEVIQVADQVKTLDPVVETSEVQRMINNHNSQNKAGRNLEIKRTVFYTGYLIAPMDTAKLLTLVKPHPNMPETDVKFLANNILITFGPAQSPLLNKVGGIGFKQTWQVTGFASLDSKVWAARVSPVPPISIFHTDNHVPFVLLAHHKTARPGDANRIQNWQPVSADKQYVFQTTVGEKVQLRVEPETEGESEYDSLLDRRYLKRRHSPPPGPQQIHRNGHGNDENRRLNGGNGNRGGTQNRGRGGGGGRSGGNNNNRGGRGGVPGRGGGGHNRGRGGGQRGAYKSLDDVGSGGGRYNAQRGEPNYDDYVPGGDNYNAAFPALGGGGLPYGK